MNDQSAVFNAPSKRKLKVFNAYGSHFNETDPTKAKPVLLMTADSLPMTFQIETLRKQGRDVAICNDLGQLQDLLFISVKRWSMLIIEIEGFGGISVMIERLLMLRRERPELAVILVSSRMAFHDFTLERLPICDVSLALPCTASDLQVAVRVAASNNAAWQLRLHELERSAERDAEAA